MNHILSWESFEVEARTNPVFYAAWHCWYTGRCTKEYALLAAVFCLSDSNKALRQTLQELYTTTPYPSPYAIIPQFRPLSDP